MNFDIKKTQKIPFSGSKETIEKVFLMWSYEKHETPLDIITNSQILEINKLYYPIRYFHNINYTANWEATSYWEHKEEYTEYESKIVFVDELGGEHRTESGAILHSGNNYCPKALSKNVPVTKSKTILDKTEHTNGIVKDSIESIYINYQKNISEQLDNWTIQIAKENSNNYNYEAPDNDCRICDLFGTDEQAFSFVKRTLLEQAETLCKKDIPGSRYSDFKMIGLDYEYKAEIILLPLFEVRYKYKDKEYKYFVNGSNLNNTFSENHPIDNEYSEKSTKLTNEIIELENKKSLYSKLVKFVFPIVFIISLICAFLFMTGTTLAVISAICEVFFILLLNQKKEKIKNLKEELEILQENRINEREKINNNNNSDRN